MAWKYRSEDRTTGVVVDPRFQGDLIGLAKVRPLWVVGSKEKPVGHGIRLTGRVGRRTLRVSRFTAVNTDDRVGNRVRVLADLDEEYGLYRGFFGYGTDDATEIRRLMDGEGSTLETCSDDFFALMIPTVRGALTARDYSKS